MERAVIFDMDGVLTDTQKIHAEIEAELLNQAGIRISASEITRRFAGVNTKEMFELLLREYGKSPKLAERLVKEKERKIIKRVQGNVKPVLGALELVKMLKSKNVPIGVATSTKKSIAEVILSSAGLLKYLDAIVGGDEVEKGKPEPDIFLEAARRLGVKPELCIVVEDGISGILGAKKAGMLTIGIGNAKEIADYACKDLEEVRKILNSILEHR